MFYGVTMVEVRYIAYEFADRQNIQHNFNEAKLAGKEWAQGFLRRNGELL
jgi:hypothetical protein